MRSLFIVALFVCVVIATFGAPFSGVLAWTWLSLLSPGQLSWGAALPLNLVIVVVTFLCWAISPEPKRLPMNSVTALWLAFMLFMVFTTLFALSPGIAWDRLDKAIKVMLLGLVVAILVTDRKRAHALVWVIALSIGYFGVKGGLFTLIKGGGGHVQGQPGTSLFDNNYLALAMGMTVPLMYYLYLHSANKFTKFGLAAATVLTVIAILGTYSRGGMIGLGAMGLFLWWRSRHRLMLGVIGLVVLIPVVQMMPAGWLNRVQSIQNTTTQDSFLTRLDAWAVAYHIALARPLIGGGFGATEDPEIYRHYSFGNSMWSGNRNLPEMIMARDRYHLTKEQADRMFPPDFTGAHAVHSIYLQILSDHGFVGLFLFLSLLLALWLKLRRIRLATRHQPDMAWASDLASMMQVAMVMFLVAGASVSMCYYDMPYLIMGLTLAVLRLTGAERSRKVENFSATGRMIIAEPVAAGHSALVSR